MRRIKSILPLLALALVAFAPPVQAASCALDGGPAATLLLPYFEVDLDNANGRTTLFSVNNASDKAALAHVVLWTDAGVPTFSFDVYLTGFDVQTINLRDIFLNGQLPRTSGPAQDPSDNISNRGDFSEDTNFPGCGNLPVPALPFNILEHLRNAHTGRASSLFAGSCSGFNHQDRVARGYVTVDVVKSCSVLVPGDAGYFGPQGIAASDNVLWGDFFYVDPAGNFSQGESLVRLHAEPGRYQNGDATFYARFVNGSGADGREPLPTVWGSRFLEGGDFNGGTELVVWRDGPWDHQPFACGTTPTGADQEQLQILAFDEQEQVNYIYPEPCYVTCPPPPQFSPFPGAASRVAINRDVLLPGFNFGWLMLDLRTQNLGTLDKFAQAWVGQISSAQGRFSVGLAGTPLAPACDAGRCSEGTETEIAEVCLLGPVQAGGTARFRVRPKGCFSSSCTQVHHAGCAVRRAGNEFLLDALFCLQPTGAPVCTPDCGGGGAAECSGGNLAAGNYVARLGELNLPFTVPNDAVQTCVGAPF